jgi:hypothetical protein
VVPRFRGGDSEEAMASSEEVVIQGRQFEAVPRSDSGVSRSERRTEDAIPRTAEADVLNERSEVQR